MDINDRITDTMTLAEQLVKVLEHENDLLKHDETEELSGLVNEKTELSLIFEKSYKALIEQEEDLKEADENLRDDLRDVAERLDKAMNENGRLLQAAIEARQTFLNLVREAAQDNTPKTGAYSASGVVDNGRGDKKTRASVAYDRSL